VYPDFARCVAAGPAPARGRRVGGIDFGYRNPFAAVWGVLADDVLWLTNEHYCRNKPLSYHAELLPRKVAWYGRSVRANERSELRCAGFEVRKGDNALRSGIAAVSARIEDGTLRVVEGCCRNLLAEAELYRYSDEEDDRLAETPKDDHNHALAALRYLVSKIDAGRNGGSSHPTKRGRGREVAGREGGGTAAPRSAGVSVEQRGAVDDDFHYEALLG